MNETPTLRFEAGLILRELGVSRSSGSVLPALPAHSRRLEG